MKKLLVLAALAVGPLAVAQSVAVKGTTLSSPLPTLFYSWTFNAVANTSPAGRLKVPTAGTAFTVQTAQIDVSSAGTGGSSNITFTLDFGAGGGCFGTFACNASGLQDVAMTGTGCTGAAGEAASASFEELGDCSVQPTVRTINVWGKWQ